MSVDYRLPKRIWRITYRDKQSGRRETDTYFREADAQHWAQHVRDAESNQYGWFEVEKGSVHFFEGEINWREVESSDR